MAKQEPVPYEPLHQAICGLKDPRMRSICLDFIQNFDLRKIQTFQELQAGYQGLLVLASALGNQSDAVRANLNLMTRILDSYSRVLKTHLEVEFPKQVKAALVDIFDSLQGKISKEDLDRIGQVIDGI